VVTNVCSSRHPAATTTGRASPREREGRPIAVRLAAEEVHFDRVTPAVRHLVDHHRDDPAAP